MDAITPIKKVIAREASFIGYSQDLEASKRACSCCYFLDWEDSLSCRVNLIGGLKKRGGIFSPAQYLHTSGMNLP